MPKPTVVQMDQLADAIRAGVVATLQERETTEVSGGALPIIIMGYFPSVSYE